MFMRLVVKFVALLVCATVIAQGGMASFTAKVEAMDMSMSQVIRPLQCTVDIVAVGPRYSVRLTPAMCNRSAAARQLLADTRASLKMN